MIHIVKLFRFHEWWDYILTTSTGVFLLALIFHRHTVHQDFGYYICLLLIQAICIVLTASFGYYLNDLMDIDSDRLAGKQNAAEGLPVFQRHLFLAILIALCVIPVALNEKVRPFILLEMFLLCMYSLPFPRLKEKKYAAIVIDSLCSGTILYVLAWSWFRTDESFINLPVLLIISWGFIKGLRNIFYHLINDAENDKLANISTLGNTWEPAKIRSAFFYLLLPAEVVIFLLLLTLTDPYAIILTLISLIIIVFLLFRDEYVVPLLVKRKHPIKTEKMLVINVYYEIFFPLMMILYAGIFHDPAWFFLIPVFLVLFKNIRQFFLYINR